MGSTGNFLSKNVYFYWHYIKSYGTKHLLQIDEIRESSGSLLSIFKMLSTEDSMLLEVKCYNTCTSGVVS